VAFPAHLAPFIVHRGSIAVDGISLTAAGLTTDQFEIQVVPYTMSHTNLGCARIHDRVNLECDMIGKYVARAVALAAPSPPLR
jgi:riboflavin synthase